ncbi:hypothetical protein MYX75_07985 [Acidobacteria bacterium AH-259-A15]|nr:hypothetical protein [Acidobacteria bacterium AH-259-A15]
MDSRYYEILRNASQEDFYRAINNPDEELYDVLWDLFETVVIEPAEIFASDFQDQNQFRYRIDAGVVLEFFPDASYFQKRDEPDPYKDNCDAAGIHLKLVIQPYMSCLFSVGFQVWGRSERLAFKKLWRQHRDLLANILHRAKPMVFTAVPFPAVDHASDLEEMLDNYFSVRDPENFIELQYPFARFDDTVSAQDFMVYMTALYHSIRDYCQKKKNVLEYWTGRMKEFYSGRSPDLPAPLPCVEVTIKTDI